jgi:3-hydroxyacyl-CoA dehydrogenase/enoyl-CoA hydratase/carnithine racemase
MTGSQNRIVTTTEIEPGIHLVLVNPSGERFNRLDSPTMQQLDAAIDRLIDPHRTDPVRGIVIASEVVGQFLGGVDLAAIAATADFEDRDIQAFCRMGRTIFEKLHRCEAVTVAAIDGNASDGGVELAMWCDYRVATNLPHTQFQFANVKVGLLPAWGGSVLLPRMTSIESAVAAIATAAPLTADEAFDEGLVDQVVGAEALIGAAVELIQNAAADLSAAGELQARRLNKTLPVPAATVADPQLNQAIAKIATVVGQSEDLYPFAPTVVMEHLLRTASVDWESALDSETAAVVQVYGSPANRGLLNHEFLVQRNQASPGLVDLTLTPQRIKKLGIIGAGVMGRSIAKVALESGIDVALVDASQNSIAIATSELSPPSFSVAADRKLEITNEYSSITDADLVIEAVVETVAVKTVVNQKIQTAVARQTLVASNTSSIPIETLAADFADPQRFCGIHFCHPEVMSLVEVIAGPLSSEQTIADAVGFVRQLGKMPVAINDGPGFVVNRLLAAMLNGALRLLVEGLTISQIDDAMNHFGFKAGPFEIIDIIGADTCMYAGRVMWEHGLSCVSLLPILPKLVKQNRLGRKTLIGFYLYPDYRAGGIVDPGLDEIVSKYQKTEVSSSVANLNQDQIALQILAPVVLEASRIIEEEVVNDFRDIELAFIHGLSFPQHRGGLLFWADQIGVDEIVKTLLRLTDVDPRLQPTDLLASMRQQKQTFYP